MELRHPCVHLGMQHHALLRGGFVARSDEDSRHRAAINCDVQDFRRDIDEVARPNSLEVLKLIDQLAAGQVSAVAFTSQSQVERLFRIAEQSQLEPVLLSGLRQTLVAAVGPVTAASLEQHGIAVDVVPQGTYFLKPLTQLLVSRLGR